MSADVHSFITRKNIGATKGLLQSLVPRAQSFCFYDLAKSCVWSSDGADDNEIDDYVANLGDDTMSGTDPESKMLRRTLTSGRTLLVLPVSGGSDESLGILITVFSKNAGKSSSFNPNVLQSILLPAVRVIGETFRLHQDLRCAEQNAIMSGKELELIYQVDEKIHGTSRSHAGLAQLIGQSGRFLNIAYSVLLLPSKRIRISATHSSWKHVNRKALDKYLIESLFHKLEGKRAPIIYQIPAVEGSDHPSEKGYQAMLCPLVDQAGNIEGMLAQLGIHDRQTHDVPPDSLDQSRLVLALNYNSWQALVDDLDRQRQQVSKHFDDLLFSADDTPAQPDLARALTTLWETGASAEQWQDVLQENQYLDASLLAVTLARFATASVHRKIDATAQRRLRRFMPLLLLQLRDRKIPNPILERILKIISQILRRSAYVSLLIENPAVLGRLVSLCENSGYGKLGGMELSYRSDLDLVFLHDSSGPKQETDGDSPLDNSLFFARLVRRLTHFLTAQTASGALYEVDTRLRPSGRSGMLVSTVEGFERYQEEHAWTWEHQALLRGRPVAGSAIIAREFERIRFETLRHRVHREKLLEYVKSMRAKMRKQLDKSTADQFDLI